MRKHIGISVTIICCLFILFNYRDKISAIASHNTANNPIPTEPGQPSAEVTADLLCDSFIEAHWGTGPTDWGLCPESTGAYISGPYPPKIGDDGEIFILDKANQRVLVYDDPEAIPRILRINSKYALQGVCNYTSPKWPNIATSNKKWFLHFSQWKGDRLVDQIATFTLGEQMETILDLEPYYPSSSGPFMNALLSDRQGGVYAWIIPGGLVHFDEKQRPTFKPLSNWDYLDNMIVGWDKHLYTYESSQDRLTDWGVGNGGFLQNDIEKSLDSVIASTNVISPTFVRLLGSDVEGKLYFIVGSGEVNNSKQFVVRIAASTPPSIATIPEPRSFMGFELGKNGELYSIVYNAKDPLIEPKIIRCVLSPGQ